jgi:hypothetical protein
VMAVARNAHGILVGKPVCERILENMMKLLETTLHRCKGNVF